jgi:hypothetical protein
VLQIQGIPITGRKPLGVLPVLAHGKQICLNDVPLKAVASVVITSIPFGHHMAMGNPLEVLGFNREPENW